MLLDGQPCATKCEQCEDVKVYVERVRESERGFEHLTDHKDSQYGKTAMHFLCFANRCSSLLYSMTLPWTSWDCGCILALCLCFHFRISVLTLSPSLSSQFSVILTLQQ